MAEVGFDWGSLAQEFKPKPLPMLPLPHVIRFFPMNTELALMISLFTQYMFHSYFFIVVRYTYNTEITIGTIFKCMVQQH